MHLRNRKIFVTVGTTKFDNLIETVTNAEVLKALSIKGYSRLVLQIGNSSLKPNYTPRHGFDSIEYFQLSPSIVEHIQSADLVISHAGAGSILEALEANKGLIVVTNELLMNNHQLELAEQLYIDGHLYYCTCKTLLDVIQALDLSKLKPFINDKSKAIANFINEVMGFE